MKKCRLSIEEPPNYSTIDTSIISPPLPQSVDAFFYYTDPEYDTFHPQISQVITTKLGVNGSSGYMVQIVAYPPEGGMGGDTVVSIVYSGSSNFTQTYREVDGNNLQC